MVEEDDKDPLEMTILQLQARFGRLPTEKEVYRFIWGSPEERQKIWMNYGLPEGRR